MTLWGSTDERGEKRRGCGVKDRNTERVWRGGFTMIEMLVVIGILGILFIALLSSFSRVKDSARKAQAQTLVSEVAIAFTRYLQDQREWAGEFFNKTEMDEKVCEELQKGKYLDITTYKVDSNGNVDYSDGPRLPKKNTASVDRFGLLDPWAQNALKKDNTQSASSIMRGGGNRSYADHRIQFRLDLDYDGFVDAPEGGVKVRASAIVWSRGPDGLDDFNQNVRYPKDDSLSWPHAQYKAK